MSQLKELINSTDIVEVNGEVGISMPDKKFRLTPEETETFLAHLKQLMDEVEFIEGKEWNKDFKNLLNNSLNKKKMTEEEIAEIWRDMVKGEKDAHRKMLHGSAKSITQENKFKLLKNNGKRNREEASSETNTSRKSIKLKGFL